MNILAWEERETKAGDQEEKGRDDERAISEGKRGRASGAEAIRERGIGFATHQLHQQNAGHQSASPSPSAPASLTSRAREQEGKAMTADSILSSIHSLSRRVSLKSLGY